MVESKTEEMELKFELLAGEERTEEERPEAGLGGVGVPLSFLSGR